MQRTTVSARPAGEYSSWVSAAITESDTNFHSRVTARGEPGRPELNVMRYMECPNGRPMRFALSHYTGTICLGDDDTTLGQV